MANLLGQYIEPNYKGMLNFETLNQGVSASLQRLTDGSGNNTPISVSNNLIGFSSAVQYDWVSTPTGSANKTTMWFDATGRMSWRPGTGASSFVRTFDATSITANRVYTLPDSTMSFIGTGAAIDSTLRSVIGGGTSTLQLSTTAVSISSGNFTVANGNIAVAGKMTSTGGYNNSSGTTVASFESSVTCANFAGSANFRTVSISYTINNSGAQTGTATGIFLNATETALNGMAHNLMDLQVGGSSKFLVRRTGEVITALDFYTLSGRYYIVGSNSSGTQGAAINSSAQGVMTFNDASIGGSIRVNWGGTSNLFPALKRNGANLEVKLADDSAYTSLIANSFFASGSIMAGGGNVGFYSGGEGIMVLRNTPLDGFNRLNFGGTTNLFPALKRNGTGLEVRLADDSAFADLSSRSISANFGLIGVTSISSLLPSARLQVDSTDRGFLPPRMTTVQKNAISSPANGLVVFDTTLNKLCVFTTVWETVTSV